MYRPSVKENKYFKISHIDNDDYDTLQVNDFFCGANKRVIRLTKHNWGIPIDYKPALHYGTGEIKPNEYSSFEPNLLQDLKYKNPNQALQI